ncbi:class I SAM-dependent methyltransferase [Kocuria sp.]|uniref:class I SAM-dependent methyltransferase n=1 Tax=Kocuria sp. TaxID=1871328 RepID=UPI0026DD7FEB|nr:class I SAM-dependent methyltransferase [Kocuria sp.]MDO4919253.1 class I SAM-dependent methyltransferase [Kocuria sp.]
MPAQSRPVGAITRGTTNPNRLRRADRYLTGVLAPLLRRAEDPLVVDLGFGAAPLTTVELWERVRGVRPDTEVLGIEIDPERVAAAHVHIRPGLSFRRGGFEIPTGGRAPVFVRAFNVLRQYPVAEVPAAWELACSRLAAGGVLMDGTCDEIGRLATWLCCDARGPQTFTVSMRPDTHDLPSDVAARLPKILIHRNVAGEPVHDFLAAADAAWLANAPLSPFGARQRWIATCRDLRAGGWPVLHGPRRWRLGELTVPWSAVAPRDAPTYQ